MSTHAPLPVLHQGKPLMTPAKQPLSAPNQAVADAIAAEWAVLGNDDLSLLSRTSEARTSDQVGAQPARRQEPKAMSAYQKLPLTGFSALTIDLITPQREAVTEELLEYGETDLLLYREDVEATLSARQVKEWNPWIEWAKQQFHTHYELGIGIVPVAQPISNADKHLAAIEALSPWQLACLAVVVKPTTSLILGLAFMRGALSAEELFHLSRLEEEYNIERWGLEEDAEEAANNLLRDLQAAQRWRDLLNS